MAGASILKRCSMTMPCWDLFIWRHSQATGKGFYAKVARDVFTYILRDMTSPEGGFYTAVDADSEGVEGKFYLWSPDEVKEVLGDEDGEEVFLQFV